MSDQEAKQIVTEVFNKISDSRSVEDIDNILTLPEISKNRMDDENYPHIEFSLTKEEILDLKRNNFIDKDNSLRPDISKKNLDPLTKLLYAVSWKNGDLKKIKHIVDGVTSIDEMRSTGLVFYQFGKYLTKMTGEPIIDQHVLRAFAVHNASSDEEIDLKRKLSLITKGEIGLINNYKIWLKESTDLNKELRSNVNFSYHIDKVLFATGKTIKRQRK